MTVRQKTGETLEFSRCGLTGRVMLWTRTSPPRLVGQEGGGEGRPAVWIEPNRLNSSVRMVHLTLPMRPQAGWRRMALVGEVAAGRFDVTVAYHEGAGGDTALFVPLDDLPLGCFALRVRGHSMEEADIHDGDYVIVRPQADADNGDLVIASHADPDDPEGYVTLKQFFREKDHIRLQPANAAMAPIHLYPQNGRAPVHIQGKVVAVVRQEAGAS